MRPSTHGWRARGGAPFAVSLRQQISPRRIKIRPRIKPTPYAGFFYTTDVLPYFSIGMANSMGAEGEKRGVDWRSSGGGHDH
jgi:hypothetical protein